MVEHECACGSKKEREGGSTCVCVCVSVCVCVFNNTTRTSGAVQRCEISITMLSLQLSLWDLHAWHTREMGVSACVRQFVSMQRCE